MTPAPSKNKLMELSAESKEEPTGPSKKELTEPSKTKFWQVFSGGGDVEDTWDGPHVVDDPESVFDRS